MTVVELTKQAVKGARRLPKKDWAALSSKISAYAKAPKANHGYARTLVGRIDEVRIRHGQWRAIGVWNDGAFDVLTIYKVGHRRDIYD